MKPNLGRPTFGAVFFLLAALALLVQAASLLDRGSKEQSDFGVFYRTCRLLDAGVSGEIYVRRDEMTGWPISIPPAGLALFQPFARLDHAQAAAGWAMFNLALAAIGVLALRRILVSLTLDRYFLVLGGVFLALAGGSVQVGQYSLHFASCWVLAVLALMTKRLGVASACLAWPTAIKAYPLLMFATPALTLSKGALLKFTAMAVVSLAVFAYGLPAIFYGDRAHDLNASFVQNVLVDPSGRLNWMQALGTTANQGVDAVLIRYLGDYSKFHERHTWVPTAGLDLSFVRPLGHAVRVLVLTFTILAVLRWRRKATGTAIEVLQMAALWSSTLYLCLPETRARYAVMAFLGFVPLLLWAKNSPSRVAVFVATFLLVLGVVPPPLDVLGLGLLGSLALWLASLQWLKQDL